MATEVVSEISGNVWKVLVRAGDPVVEDCEMVILESMKMEIPVVSPVSGVVEELFVSEGMFVPEGEVIAVVREVET